MGVGMTQLVHHPCIIGRASSTFGRLGVGSVATWRAVANFDLALQDAEAAPTVCDECAAA